MRVYSGVSSFVTSYLASDVYPVIKSRRRLPSSVRSGAYLQHRAFPAY